VFNTQGLSPILIHVIIYYGDILNILQERCFAQDVLNLDVARDHAGIYSLRSQKRNRFG
jgi:hypothetical protein